MAMIKIFLSVMISSLSLSAFAQTSKPEPQYCVYQGSSITMGETNQSYHFDGTVQMKPTNRPGLYLGQSSLDFGVGRLQIEIQIADQKYTVRPTIKNGFRTLLKGGLWTKMPVNLKGSIRYTSEFFGEDMIAVSKLHPNNSIWNMPWEPEFPRDKEVVQNLKLSCFVGPKPNPGFWERFFN